MNEGTISASDEMNRLSCQLPPETSFVSLSHAISWIAFGHSISGSSLAALLNSGKNGGAFEADKSETLAEAIKYAVQRLADFGLDQKIVLYGRFFRDVLDNEFEIFTEQIPAVRLADYQWFDTLDDSLHRGSGQVWTGDPSKPNYPYGDDRHYRFVTVSRADLIREFPASTATQQTGVSLFTVAEIDAWIESAPYSGMKVARKAFLKELRAKGLSASFEREWQAIKKNPVGRPITRK